MLLYLAHEIFMYLVFSFYFLFALHSCCRWSHRPTEIEETRWLKNFWAVWSKLNQANFHLHIWGFHSIETCFKNWICASSYSAACTISGHKQRAFLRFLKLLYLSLHRTFNRCASFTSFVTFVSSEEKCKNCHDEKKLQTWTNDSTLWPFTAIAIDKERENTRKYEHGKVLWSPWKKFPFFLFLKISKMSGGKILFIFFSTTPKGLFTTMLRQI